MNRSFVDRSHQVLSGRQLIAADPPYSPNRDQFLLGLPLIQNRGHITYFKPQTAPKLCGHCDHKWIEMWRGHANRLYYCHCGGWGILAMAYIPQVYQAFKQ